MMAIRATKFNYLKYWFIGKWKVSMERPTMN
jgi:hypothetical protein